MSEYAPDIIDCWQPIETALKYLSETASKLTDPLLGFIPPVPNSYNPDEGITIIRWYIGGRQSGWSSSNNDYAKPTHWMPFPKAPK